MVLFKQLVLGIMSAKFVGFMVLKFNLKVLDRACFKENSSLHISIAKAGL